MIIFIKTKEEIEGFIKAGKLAAEVMQEMLEEIKPGVSTNDLNKLVLDFCGKHKVNPVFLGHEGFPAAICASPNKTLVHGIPTDEPLVQGDVLSVDVGIEIDGFIGDTAETVIVGEEQNYSTNGNLILCCRDALRAGIDAARPGKNFKDVAAAVSKVAKGSGFSLPKNYGGHGIDVGNMHAHPFVGNREDECEDIILRPGMVFAIEPMFINGNDETHTLEDKWSVVANGTAAHCEHTVLVTEGEPLVLTERS